MTSMTDAAPVPASRTTEGAARRTRPPQRGMILGMVAWLIGWIAATSLICFIFSWNGLLFARVLTGTVVQTGPVFLTGFVASLGLFLAKVCAAAFVVSLPVIIAGFAAQDKLVQGLSLGAVK
jgi:sorbitol/mannitol transport system permease protein